MNVRRKPDAEYHPLSGTWRAKPLMFPDQVPAKPLWLIATGQQAGALVEAPLVLQPQSSS